MPSDQIYSIERAAIAPTCDGNPEHAAWRNAESAAVTNFRPESTPGHSPLTTVRLLYDASALYALFVVNESHVRCVHKGWMAPVCRDSCVELFARPRADGGYFNFEVNCGGGFLCSYVENWTRTATGLERFTPFTPELCRQFRIYHSLPETIDPELAGPVEWRVELHIPLSALETFTGPLGTLSGTEWTGNMYKCAEDNSRPHWAAWSPVSALNFHAPEEFGTLRFE